MSFALERLSTPDEAETRRHHAVYFLAFAEQAAQFMVGREKKAWLDRLERDDNNLRTALRWLIDHSGEEALRLAGGARRLFGTRGATPAKDATGWRSIERQRRLYRCACPRLAGGQVNLLITRATIRLRCN